MSLIQIFTYVAYAFGFIFLAGALTLFVGIFKSTKTKEEKKIAKMAARDRKNKTSDTPESATALKPAGSFFGNRGTAQVKLPTLGESGTNAIQESIPVAQFIPVKQQADQTHYDIDIPSHVEQNIPSEPRPSQETRNIPSEPRPSQETRNIPKPVNVDNKGQDNKNPSFPRPNFSNSNIDLKPASKENGKFNFPF